MITYTPLTPGYGSISQALREAKALVEMLEHAPFVDRLLTDMPAAVAGLADVAGADTAGVTVRYLEHNNRLMLVAEEGPVPPLDTLAGVI